jgi:hypothetical protein
MTEKDKSRGGNLWLSWYLFLPADKAEGTVPGYGPRGGAGSGNVYPRCLTSTDGLDHGPLSPQLVPVQRSE